MVRDEAKDAVESPGHAEHGRRHAHSQTSQPRKSLRRLRESRGFSVLYRPGVLSIVGASIGVLSMTVMTWGSYEVWRVSPDFRSAGIVTEHLSFIDLLTISEPAIIIALTAFLIGTILSFFMPAFGLLQGLGIMGFIVNWHSAVGDYTRFSEPEFGLGYYLAVGSTMIVLVGCKATYGRTFGSRPVPTMLRIAALSPYGTRLRE